MDEDAAAALGAPEVAGSFVNPRGLVKKLTAATAGSVARDPGEGAPDIPHFGRVGYLSLTRDEIAIVKTRSGFRMRITEVVLARVQRTAISSVEFDGGMLLSHLTISFDNDVVWEFDIPKVNKKTCEQVVRELRGSVLVPS
jgi:hypothetical protein